MKPIVLKYVINGAKFKRQFDPDINGFMAAKNRIAVLAENGIDVTVRNMPKRITVG